MEGEGKIACLQKRIARRLDGMPMEYQAVKLLNILSGLLLFQNYWQRNIVIRDFERSMNYYRVIELLNIVIARKQNHP